MKSAVIKIKGKQYWIKEGDELLVDRINEKEKLEPQVLLVADGDKLTLGNPFVLKAKIKLEVLGEAKGEKLQVFKYKAKSRYRRKKGFRPIFTKIKVSEISS